MSARGKLAQTLAHKPKGPLVFVHANLFDAESAQMLPNRTVVITGNKITAVGADGQVPLPKNAETIDASRQNADARPLGHACSRAAR